ncbi:MAG TPA: hypothetical protein VM432_07705 [Bdellovibrionales bacterium]|nr:hypothetical protein [Bdellovibrionales bacterium]
MALLRFLVVFLMAGSAWAQVVPLGKATPAPTPEPKVAAEEKVVPLGQEPGADDNEVFGSEFFHQPAFGENEITAGIGVIISSSVQRNSRFYESTATGIDPLSFQFAYGVGEKTAVGFRLAYASYQVSAGGDSDKAKGLYNPVLFFSGMLPKSGFKINYGADVILPFQKGKVESNGDSNVASGEFSIAPTVGAEIPASWGFFGPKLRYLIRGERETEFTTVDAKYKDGNRLSLVLFNEWKLDHSRVGVRVNQNWVEESKITSPGTERTSSASYEWTSANVYARIASSPTFEILPDISHAFRRGGYDKYSSTDLKLDFRFIF